MKKSYFGIMQPLMFGARPSRSGPAVPPVIDSSALTFTSYYEDGGLMQINGAKATGYTDLQWQRQADGSWQDVAGQTSLNLSRVTSLAEQGNYRLRAVNGDSEPVYSSVVPAKCAFIYMQNDIAPSDSTFVQNSKTEYTWTTGAGVKYLSAFLRYWDDPSSNVRRLTRSDVSWTTSNSTVAPVTNFNSNGNGQLQPNLKAGSAVVTVSGGTMQTKFNLIVS